MSDKQIGDIEWTLEIWRDDFGINSRIETFENDEAAARARAQEILDTEPDVFVIYLIKNEVIDIFERE